MMSRKEEYLCRQCQTRFAKPDVPDAREEVKCPVCQSADFVSMRDSNKVMEFLRSMMYSGGG